MTFIWGDKSDYVNDHDAIVSEESEQSERAGHTDRKRDAGERFGRRWKRMEKP